MSSSLPRLAVATLSLALLGGGAGAAISACSSSSSDPGTTPDAAPQGPADSGRITVDAAPEEPVDAAKPETTEQCFDRCDKEHAGSVKKYTAVDDCWEAKCDEPCNNMGAFDAGPDAADAEALADGGHLTDGGPLCGTPFGSGAGQACDDCTTLNCCTEWKGCYNDTDCQDLEGCYQDCP